MKIKPLAFGEVHDEIEVHEIDIIADDGRTLFTISCNQGGQLEISTNMCVKHNDLMFDSAISITPIASNRINVMRKVYK